MVIFLAWPRSLREIAQNAGEEGTVVVEKVKNLKGNLGYDARTGEYGDMIKLGIIDPAKVARTALQNAASISSLLPEMSPRPRQDQR